LLSTCVLGIDGIPLIYKEYLMYINRGELCTFLERSEINDCLELAHRLTRYSIDAYPVVHKVTQRKILLVLVMPRLSFPPFIPWNWPWLDAAHCRRQHL
jgi:hypothetical protein